MSLALGIGKSTARDRVWVGQRNQRDGQEADKQTGPASRGRKRRLVGIRRARPCLSWVAIAHPRVGYHHQPRPWGGLETHGTHTHLPL